MIWSWSTEFFFDFYRDLSEYDRTCVLFKIEGYRTPVTWRAISQEISRQGYWGDLFLRIIIKHHMIYEYRIRGKQQVSRSS